MLYALQRCVWWLSSFNGMGGRVERKEGVHRGEGNGNARKIAQKCSIFVPMGTRLWVYRPVAYIFKSCFHGQHFC